MLLPLQGPRIELFVCNSGIRLLQRHHLNNFSLKTGPKSSARVCHQASNNPGVCTDPEPVSSWSHSLHPWLLYTLQTSLVICLPTLFCPLFPSHSFFFLLHPSFLIFHHVCRSLLHPLPPYFDGNFNTPIGTTTNSLFSWSGGCSEFSYVLTLISPEIFSVGHAIYYSTSYHCYPSTS